MCNGSWNRRLCCFGSRNDWGIVYYVVKQGGKKKVIDHQGNTLMNIEDFVVKRDEEDGREYVEVNTIEECKLVKPAIGRDVQNWKLKNGKVRCMLFPNK